MLQAKFDENLLAIFKVRVKKLLAYFFCGHGVHTTLVISNAYSKSFNVRLFP